MVAGDDDDDNWHQIKVVNREIAVFQIKLNIHIEWW